MPAMKKIMEIKNSVMAQNAQNRGEEAPGEPAKELVGNYCEFLNIIENQDQFRSVKKLHQKIVR